MENDSISENIMLMSGKFKKEKEYWIDKLSGDFIISSFPSDFKKDYFSRHNKSVFSCKLPENVGKELINISNKSDLGLYMILICGVSYLLNKYTDSDDIIVGMPAFNYNREDTANENFVSAIRTKFKSNWSFKDLLMDMRAAVNEAEKYSNIPFNVIAEVLGLQTDDGNLPKLKTFASLENIHQTLAQAGLEAEVAFLFIRTDDTIDLKIEYDIELFTQDTIQRMTTHLNNFYSNVIENTSINLTDTKVFADKEINQVICDFNRTKVDFPRNKTLHELFEEQVNITPEKVALIFKDNKLTYRELNERSNRIAHLLRDKGVKSNSVVGILVERSFDMIIGILGILKAGGAYLPIDSEYPGERIKYMLNDSGADLLLTKNRFMHYVNFERESIYLDDVEINEYPVSNPEVKNTSGDLAYVIYTSGSTGEPKGAAIEHISVVNFIKGITDRIEFRPENTILALTTICFDIFLLETLLPLTQGLAVVIADEAEQRDPRLLNTLIINEKINMLQMTPSRMQLLLSYGEKLTCLENVKVIMLGGEVFPKTLHESVRNLTQAKIYNMYGPIETTIWSTVMEVGQEGEVNIGKPIANTRVYILGRNHSLMVSGIPGELCIAGEGLARGYINKDGLTSEKFVSDPFSRSKDSSITEDRIYHTGDLAKWLPDGNIEFLGRKDYQVKIRGFRIELGEIEALFLKYEGIKDVAVVDKIDHDGSTYLCAYVVIEEDLNFIEIKEYLSKNLPYYMLPTHYRKLDKMPLTQNGKIDRKALKKLDDTALKTEYVAPGTELEKKLVEIWQEVLKVEKVGIDDDIEGLGGNSFLAMKLELSMEMNDIEVTNVEIYQNRTIRKLAEYIENKQESESAEVREDTQIGGKI